MPAVAFKEWAVVCRALATGRQALILRKGGIAEAGGVFRPEHPRFWLYPTHFHEQQRGVKQEALPLLEEAGLDRRPAGTVRFTTWADVTDVFFAESLDRVLALDDLHVWTPDVVTQRFHYRSPGLYVLSVRVWQTPPIDVPEDPAFAGCKTWVELNHGLPTDGRPVLTDDEFAVRSQTLRDRLTPSR